MGALLLGKHFAELASASTPTVAVAAAAAGAIFAQIAAVILAVPLWLFVVAALAPWIPILILELSWTYRHKQLIEAASHLEAVRLRAGEWIEPHPEWLYIVTSGTGALVRQGPGEHDILLRVLAPGEVVKVSGTLKADTALELLALPAHAL